MLVLFLFTCYPRAVSIKKLYLFLLKSESLVLTALGSLGLLISCFLNWNRKTKASETKIVRVT